MDDVVSKPLDARTLFQVIERLGRGSSPAPPGSAETPPADPALEARLTRLVAEHAPHLLAAARDALDRADLAGAAAAAHTLKGAVGNLPQRTAYDAAERLEALARDGNLGEARTAYATVERVLADLLTAIPPAAAHASTVLPDTSMR
jgi:HPt (histidine-containing phosphotransfer) domain-containing protein